MTRSLLAASLLSLAAVAAPAQAQSPAAATPTLADANWNAFLGCWRAVDDPAGTGSRVCFAPAPTGVTVTTIVGGQRVGEDTRVADGSARPVDADGCRGTETARWSANGVRLYRRATISCDGGTPRTLATASFFVAGQTLVDVETVEADGTTNVRVSRMVRASNQQLPDGTTLTRPTGARGPSAEAMKPFTVADVIDLSGALPADGVQAAISEAPTPYRLNAKALVAMADAGVGDRVIDLMVGVTYPAKFEVRRASSGGGGGGFGGGIGISSMADPFFSPLVGPAALFNCYSSYGWASAGYWGSCAGYDPLMYGRFPGFYNGYWGPYGPDWIVTQPGVGGPSTPVEPVAEGRLVNGRGYTQVRPIETTASMGGDGGRSSGMSNGGSSSSGSSGSSGSTGVSGSGYSGGGGGGDRMAVPRGPGGE